MTVFPCFLTVWLHGESSHAGCEETDGFATFLTFVEHLPGVFLS